MKNIFTFFFLLIGVSAFSYNNSADVFVQSYDSGGTGYGTKSFIVNSYTSLNFRCTFTNGSSGPDSYSSGYATLKHGGQLIDSFNYNGSNGSYNSTFTGQWYVMELNVSCSSNAIGLAQVIW